MLVIYRTEANCWTFIYQILQIEETKRKFVKKPEKIGIKWQTQPKKKWLADLLVNEKTVASLLRFLEITNIGGRESAKKRELGWEWRNDQAGIDLLE